MHQILFWKFLRHIGAFLDHLAGVDTPAGRVPVPKTGPNWANISAFMRSNVPNTFWRFLRHIGTFLDYLTGVDTPVGRVCVPRNKAKLSKYMGSGEVNISASIKASCTTFIWEVSETYRNICIRLGRCWHTHELSASVHHPGQVEEIHGKQGGQYLSFY